MDFFKKMDVTKNQPNDASVEGKDAEHVKCLIIGSGPAGYTAAIYAARANLKPVMVQGMQAGGQLTTTTEVENFPGYPEGTDGTALMEDLKKQAERFGTEIRWGTVTKVDFTGPVHKVIVDDSKLFTADAVIIATGATAKYLGIPSEEKYRGGGVSACATCDGFFYRGKDVAVVGGGDTACEEATYLAGLCNKVYLIVRKDFLRASKAMQQRVFNTKNIEVLFEHQTKELFGDGVVEGARLIKKQGTSDEKEVAIKIDGFFLAIGHTPNSEVFKPFLETDETGYIVTKPGSTHTNVKGVFACGDVQDHVYRQAITAAGTGCMAALDTERYLAELHS
ncbi:MAG TPA: thioredoxin-disulfide reductase [Marinilabiliales bacterium]|jgi:thioredoxin reductase (NADPH)|nr:thioredoxin-disulfide reductase [Marinilabiliales bacterium]HAZ03189.1 thioredoxin-disulfide reductase [Marinilabiliales bacterium]HBO73576.1 thioredoxin-disulfide reductase [Marinilabiliales bacterium]HBX86352.1 thioredoxin-disulfide reductase [Marinilabiliales bacterium]HBY53044.1 thioredoxin-disulfide reductase [Marinilabiliales bacterium]